MKEKWDFEEQNNKSSIHLSCSLFCASDSYLAITPYTVNSVQPEKIQMNKSNI